MFRYRQRGLYKLFPAEGLLIRPLKIRRKHILRIKSIDMFQHLIGSICYME